MKKIPVFIALITMLACGVYAAGPLDHFVVSVDLSTTTTGVEKSATVFAYDSSAVLVDTYAGPAYLACSDGVHTGEVIVTDTGTNATGAFTGGSWTGNIKILLAGTVTVEAHDGAVTTLVPPAVTMLAAPYQKVKLIVDDMVFAPGTVAGHTGTAKQQNTHVDFNAAVYACDDWNNPVIPTVSTGIKLTMGFSGGGYIAVTPFCGASTSYDLFADGASGITFTVSVWPASNVTQLRKLDAVDVSKGYDDPLDIMFISSDSFYYNTEAPVNVTAGVPFGVTVLVSNFPPALGQTPTPDTTFIQSVDIKAIKSSDASDAVPPLCNNLLVPQPTPLRAQCAAGEAYFNVAYTKAGTIFVLPIPVGATPVVNATPGNTSRYSPLITVGSAAPQSFTFTTASGRLQRGTSTQLSVSPYDIFGNPVTGTAVVFDIVGGTKNGYFNGSPGVSQVATPTNGFGTAYVSYTAPDGNYENIINATVAPLVAPQSVTVLSELTDKFENWPNPFIAGKETTKINYALPEDSAVKLRLYSSFGKLAWSKDIVKGEVVASENHGKKGGNTIVWNGTGDRGFVLGAGVYILKMTVTNSTGTTVHTRKIAIVK